MSERTQFRLYISIAGLLYAWGLGVLWVAHDWGMTERQYLIVALLPVLVGVVCMTMALLSYMELQQEDEEGNPDRTEENPSGT